MTAYRLPRNGCLRLPDSLHLSGKYGVILNLDTKGLNSMDAVNRIGKDLACRVHPCRRTTSRKVAFAPLRFFNTRLDVSYIFHSLEL